MTMLNDPVRRCTTRLHSVCQTLELDPEMEIEYGSGTVEFTAPGENRPLHTTCTVRHSGVVLVTPLQLPVTPEHRITQLGRLIDEMNYHVSEGFIEKRPEVCGIRYRLSLPCPAKLIRTAMLRSLVVLNLCSTRMVKTMLTAFVQSDLSTEEVLEIASRDGAWSDIVPEDYDTEQMWESYRQELEV